jgi:low affinity Fe/Cu permease
MSTSIKQPSRTVASVPCKRPAPRPHRSSIGAAFDHFACTVTKWAGSPYAFCAALLCVIVWAGLGKVFDFSETWQLVINTGTTIVTFLMVFLIQQSQNKDSVALHLKMDELIVANRDASNKMVGVEDLDEDDLRQLAAHYTKLAARVGREADQAKDEDDRRDAKSER